MLEIIIDHVVGLLKELKKEIISELAKEIRMSEATVRYDILMLHRKVERLEQKNSSPAEKK